MQYLVSVIDDTAGSRHPDRDGCHRRRSTTGSRPRATGSSPAASGRPARPPSSTTAVGRRCSPTGPFVESKEYLAGFWIIEAADLDVALKLAAEGSKACNRKVEVRPFL